MSARPWEDAEMNILRAAHGQPGQAAAAQRALRLIGYRRTIAAIKGKFQELRPAADLIPQWHSLGADGPEEKT